MGVLSTRRLPTAAASLPPDSLLGLPSHLPRPYVIAGGFCSSKSSRVLSLCVSRSTYSPNESLRGIANKNLLSMQYLFAKLTQFPSISQNSSQTAILQLFLWLACSRDTTVQRLYVLISGNVSVGVYTIQ